MLLFVVTNRVIVSMNVVASHVMSINVDCVGIVAINNSVSVDIGTVNISVCVMYVFVVARVDNVDSGVDVFFERVVYDVFNVGDDVCDGNTIDYSVDVDTNVRLLLVFAYV